MSFSFVEESTNIQTQEETLLMLAYNLGSVAENFIRAKRYDERGYESDMHAGLADVASMVRMFCEQKGWDFEELLRFGEQHYLERQEDLEKHSRYRGGKM